MSDTNLDTGKVFLRLDSLTESKTSMDDSLVWYAESFAFDMALFSGRCVTGGADDVYTASQHGDVRMLAADDTAESVSVTERREAARSADV